MNFLGILMSIESYPLGKDIVISHDFEDETTGEFSWSLKKKTFPVSSPDEVSKVILRSLYSDYMLTCFRKLTLEVTDCRSFVLNKVNWFSNLKVI